MRNALSSSQKGLNVNGAHELPAGTQLQAGLGVATVLPDIDFETYSEAGYVWDAACGKWGALPGASGNKKGLGIVGTAVYAAHPSTEVLTLSYNLKDGLGVRRWRPGLPLPTDLFSYLERGGLIEAHNSMFEWWIWNYCAIRRYGFPPLRQAQLRCSMSKARASGLPGALGPLSDVLALHTRKDKDGDRLLKKFSVPRDPTKKDARTRITPADDPLDGERLYGYCDTDTIAESEASAQIADLEGEELEYWLLDQRINQRGVHVDRAGIHNAIAIIDEAHAVYNGELAQITGGIKASELQQLSGWLLGKHGIFMGSMDEDSIAETLKRTDLHPEARRALEIRGAVGSASVKKVYAMANQLTDDDRLHCLFNYHAARTGRPTGEGPQPTNLPKVGPPLVKCGVCRRYHAVAHPACPWCGLLCPPGRKALDWSSEMVEQVLEVMESRSYHLLEYYYGSAMAAVSGCLRGLFTAAPGHDLICSDFNAIEGVVTAQLAGEEWRLEVFRTHGKIYEMSASKITGVPFEEMMEYKKQTGNHHPMRNKIGKYAELALGFGGWINAMVQFGADEFLSEPEMKTAILGWRAASPMVVELWGGQYRGLPWEPGGATPELFGLEGAAIKAMFEPGVWQTYRDISYIFWADILHCRLPSGRLLRYQRPRVTQGEWFGLPTMNLSYEGWNTNPKNGPMGWIRINTYGGRLTENVVQATARDIQRYAKLQLERAGYPIVLHVYDEDVAEVPEGFGSVEEFESIMKTMPAWAHGWPIKASGGWRGKRYRKD
jgi:DNA polymerase